MSNVVFLRKPSTAKAIPIRDRDEIERVSIQYCTNLTTIFRQMCTSLGPERTADTITEAARAASEDHETDKRSG